MAQRNVIHVLKYSPQPNKSLPSPSLVQVGEPLVNTADGKMYLKGFISGTGATSYVQSLQDGNYFEVGSHLSQLKIDDKIISYDGFEGSNLEGKFLSGSTNGFEVVPFSALSNSIDSYVSGGTFNKSGESLTLQLSNNKPNVIITGFTRDLANGSGLFSLYANNSTNNQANGNYSFVVGVGNVANGLRSSVIGGTNITGQSADTVYVPNLNINYTPQSGTSSDLLLVRDSLGNVKTVVQSGITGVDTFVTGFTYSNNVATIRRNGGQPDLPILINTMSGLTVNGILSATTGNIGTTNTTTLNATGGTITTLGSTTANVNTLNVTGGTITTLSSTTLNLGRIASYSGLTNVSNQFLSGTTNGFALAPISAITGVDTYTTGFTFNSGTSTINLNQNGTSFSALSLNIRNETNKSVTNLTAGTLNVTGLTANSIVYVDGSKNLKTDTGFNYNETNNSLTLPTNSSLFVGSGGTVIGYGGTASSSGVGDLTVHGNLTVFGQSISALTTELYVEDKNVIINFSPTGDTTANSLGAGLTIQDGLGVSGASNDVFLQIAQTGIPTTIPTAYANRFLESNLFNLMLGSSGATGSGFYVIKEQDILDGGSY